MFDRSVRMHPTRAAQMIVERASFVMHRFLSATYHHLRLTRLATNV